MIYQCKACIWLQRVLVGGISIKEYSSVSWCRGVRCDKQSLFCRRGCILDTSNVLLGGWVKLMDCGFISLNDYVFLYMWLTVCQLKYRTGICRYCVVPRGHPSTSSIAAKIQGCGGQSYAEWWSLEYAWGYTCTSKAPGWAGPCCIGWHYSWGENLSLNSSLKLGQLIPIFFICAGLLIYIVNYS